MESLEREMMDAVDARQVDNNAATDYITDAQDQMNPPLRHNEVNMVLVEGNLISFQLNNPNSILRNRCTPPICKVYNLSSTTILNKRNMVSVDASGYSRIQVYEEQSSHGIVYSK
eukprot:scaffold3074_cov280-Chaetoceros_neogracile.AAC.10